MKPIDVIIFGKLQRLVDDGYLGCALSPDLTIRQEQVSYTNSSPTLNGVYAT